MRETHSPSHSAETETDCLYGRWREYGEPKPTAGAPVGKTHTYTLAMKPERPLEMGMKVRIVALYPKTYCSPEDALLPTGGPEEYAAYDPHLVGTIDVNRAVEGKVVVRMENLCRANPVKRVELWMLPEEVGRAEGERRKENVKEGEANEEEEEWEVVGRRGKAITIYDVDMTCRAEECELEDPERSCEDSFGSFRLAGAVDGRTLYAEKRKAEGLTRDVTKETCTRRKRLRYE